MKCARHFVQTWNKKKTLQSSLVSTEKSIPFVEVSVWFIPSFHLLQYLVTCLKKHSYRLNQQVLAVLEPRHFPFFFYLRNTSDIKKMFFAELFTGLSAKEEYLILTPKSMILLIEHYF